MKTKVPERLCNDRMCEFDMCVSNYGNKSSRWNCSSFIHEVIGLYAYARMCSKAPYRTRLETIRLQHEEFTRRVCSIERFREVTNEYQKRFV